MSDPPSSLDGEAIELVPTKPQPTAQEQPSQQVVVKIDNDKKAGTSPSKNGTHPTHPHHSLPIQAWTLLLHTIINPLRLSLFNLPHLPDPHSPQEVIQYSVPFPPRRKVERGNYIRTTKYTIITFIPLNLYFQFRRFYNFYFLLGAISVFAGFSSLSYASQILPLAVVLCFSGGKDGLEDFNRYRADTQANTTPAYRVHPSSLSGGPSSPASPTPPSGQPLRAQVPSMSLAPGDLVLILKGEKFQVDVVLVGSSWEDGGAFIETAELDGETNLKRKSTVQTSPAPSAGQTPYVLSHDAEITLLRGRIECEEPNEKLLSFEGRFTLETPEGGDGVTQPLSMLNFVPRGSVLRNTDYVYGVVVYAGLDTKIMKNLKQGKLKSSSLERRLNVLVLYAFVFNAVLLVVSIILEYVNYNSLKSGENYTSDLQAVNWYIGFQTPSTSYHVWASTVAFFTLYTYVIPISLFVTIELCRLGQANYMVWDPKMIWKPQESDGTEVEIPMRANNSNLNEDLGCIDYIFSDKTGTLTQNSMNMSNYWCDGYVLDEMKEAGVLFRYSRDTSIPEGSRNTMSLFLRALSLCHGVIPAYDEKRKEMIYESQSPDETALLIAARTNKYSLTKRTKQFIEVEVDGTPVKFETLITIEFNSTRKRMSIVVRTPEGKVHLYCKGADNIMMARLDKGKNDKALLEKADKSLTEFSNIGLRTLVVAYRTLSEEEYSRFKKAYDEAEINLEDREGAIGKAAELVETGLILVGCTAIEDKLQDQVPETIENLLNADIKLWLLTGDKQETAINIGLSSRLINKQMNLLILNAQDPSECEVAMDKLITLQQSSPPSQIFAMVVDGHVLSHVFAGSDNSKGKFLTIGTRCKTVICARVTPLQKALVVRLVRKALKGSITLAIGDGANDVSMIQEAHIGVGIMGKEGTQAVRASDYAFGEFRFLQRLLTVHGRFNYLRMAGLILFSFFKNFVFITVQFYFGFVNSWSGQTVYEELFFIAFNVVFTSIPPLLYGLFERDLPEQLLEQYPQLYKQVKQGLYWNAVLITRWFFLSMYCALMIFGVAYYLNYWGTLDVLGRSTGYWVQCYLFSTPLLVVILLKYCIMTKFWVLPTFWGVIISLVLNIALMFGVVILEYFTYVDYETSIITHALPAYYLLLLLLPSVCTLPDLFVEYMTRLFWPSDSDIAIEYSVQNKLQI